MAQGIVLTCSLFFLSAGKYFIIIRLLRSQGFFKVRCHCKIRFRVAVSVLTDLERVQIHLPKKKKIKKSNSLEMLVTSLFVLPDRKGSSSDQN